MMDSSGPPDRDRWQELEELFAMARELNADARTILLDSPQVRDSGLRDELESLLVAERDAGEFLETPAGTEHLSRLGTAPEGFEGRRFGPYRVLSEIARGGMGTVYRAVRDDDSFRKEVALKVLSSGWEAEVFQERFRRERQILASLEHPNIARLLDGGAGEEGRPFYVMELVDGVPIDLYCRQKQLGANERLQLVRVACEAVGYAHSRLIVHRDLKPANFLVAADGTLKLLDFGIAKLLTPATDETGPGAAETCLWMTPEYASPEQVRGRPVSTATDVYALGVLLYELLTGRRPYRLGSRSLEEVSRAICEQVPTAPSRVVEHPAGDEPSAGGGVLAAALPCGSVPDQDSRRLRRKLQGDLDTIVLRALSKEPERRYPSVAQLSEDLLRHLTGRPVRARPDQAGYRLGKFVRRNRAAVTLGLLTAASLIVGVASTIREAGIAGQQRLVAERRFDDVRRLAGTFIFEVHDAVASLPGATPVRKLIVERGLEYLTRLESEGPAAPELQAELATAFERIADVQGGVGVANLGDVEGAVASRRRALALRQEVADAQPGIAAQLLLASAHSRLGDLLEEAGDRAARAFHYDQALTLRRRAAARAPEDPAVRRALALSVWDAAQLQVDQGDLAGGLAGFEEALEQYRLLAVSGDRQPADQRNLALAYKKVGAVRSASGDVAGALACLMSALSIDEARLAERPDDPEARLDVSFDEGDLGHVFLKSGEAGLAVEHYERAVVLRQAVSTADPQDVRARRALGTAKARLALALVAAAPGGDVSCAALRPNLERAMALWAELAVDGSLDSGVAAERDTAEQRLRRCR